jgi:hypothetical protein
MQKNLSSEYNIGGNNNEKNYTPFVSPFVKWKWNVGRHWFPWRYKVFFTFVTIIVAFYLKNIAEIFIIPLW